MNNTGIWLLEPMRSSLRNRESPYVFEKELVTNLAVIQCVASDTSNSTGPVNAVLWPIVLNAFERLRILLGIWGQA